MKKCYIDYVADVKNHNSDHAILQVHIDLTNSAPEKARYRDQQKKVWRRILYAKRKAIADFTRCKTGEECCPGAIPGVPDYICDDCMFGPGLDPVLTR